MQFPTGVEPLLMVKIASPVGTPAFLLYLTCARNETVEPTMSRREPIFIAVNSFNFKAEETVGIAGILTFSVGVELSPYASSFVKEALAV